MRFITSIWFILIILPLGICGIQNDSVCYSQELFSAEEDSTALKYAGSALWSNIRDMVTDDKYAYCAMSAGIQIFDVSSPNITSVAKLFLGSGAVSLAKKNNILYAALKSGGIQIVDISNPLRPKLMGSLSTSTGNYNGAIAVDEDYALLGYKNHLDIIDVADPYNPFIFNTYILDTAIWVTIHDIEIQDQKAYVAAYDLWILDISDLSNIHEMARRDFGGEVLAVDLVVKDTLLYATCMSNVQPPINSGFAVINIKNPDNPEPVSMYYFPGNADKLSIMGDTAYVSASLSGVLAVDIGDPEDPHPIACAHTPNYFTTCTALSGNRLIAGQRGYFPRFDEHGMDICNDGDYLEETDYKTADQLVMYDLGSADTLVAIGNYPDGGFSQQVVKSGDYAYVSDITGGISVVDVSNPHNMQRISYLDLPLGNLYSFHSQMSIYDNIIFLSLNDNDLALVEVSNPFSPRLLYIYDTHVFEPDAVLVGNYVLVAEGSWGLNLLELLPSNELAFVSNFQVAGSAIALEIKDNYAILGAGRGGLQILDISDVKNAFIVSSLQDDRLIANRIAVGSDYVAVTGKSKSFFIVDISNVYEPKLTAYLEVDDFIENMAAYGHALFIEDTKGIKLYDISDLETPVLVSSFSPPGWALGLEVSDSFVYVADYSSMFALRYKGENPDIPIPENYKLNQNYPNPFNSSTIISFEVPQYGHIEICIYNILGQKVKTLTNEYYPEGEYTISWDGTDSNGNRMATGIYFYQLKGTGIKSAKKMLLLK